MISWPGRIRWWRNDDAGRAPSTTLLKPAAYTLTRSRFFSRGIAGLISITVAGSCASDGFAKAPVKTPYWRTICGWISNPTPANWSLIDRDGEWEIGVQGGRQATGLDTLPDLTRHEWIAQNGSYGTGCACLQAQVVVSRHEIRALRAFRQLPLNRCRADQRLGQP